MTTREFDASINLARAAGRLEMLSHRLSDNESVALDQDLNVTLARLEAILKAMSSTAREHRHEHEHRDDEWPDCRAQQQWWANRAEALHRTQSKLTEASLAFQDAAFPNFSSFSS